MVRAGSVGGYMIKRWIQICMCMVVIFVFSACGKGNAPISSADEQTINWKSEEIVCGQEISAENLYVQGLKRWDVPADSQTEWGVLDVIVCKEGFARLSVATSGDNVQAVSKDTEYLIEKICMETGNIDKIVFSPKMLGIADEAGLFGSIVSLNDENCCLRWISYDVNEDGLYSVCGESLITTNLKVILERTDINKTVDGKPLYSVDEYEIPLMSSLCYYMDNKGEILVESMDRALYFFDKSNKLLTPAFEKKREVAGVILSEVGEFIIATSNPEHDSYYLSYFDSVDKTVKDISGFDSNTISFSDIFLKKNNTLYYSFFDRSGGKNSEKLVSWNLKTGERKTLLEYSEAGIGSSSKVLFFTDKADKTVLLFEKYTENGRQHFVTSLADIPPKVAEKTAIAYYSGSKELLTKAMVNATGSTNYDYEIIDASSEEQKERLEQELMSSGGPQLLCLDTKTFENYVEKGLVCSIEDFLYSDTKAALLKGALEIGNRNGTVYGIPLGVTVETFSVSAKANIPSDWSLEGALDMFASGKLSTTIKMPSSGGHMFPAMEVLVLINPNIRSSFLIDWEAGKCSFVDKRFVGFLDAIKSQKKTEYSDKWYMDEDELVCNYIYVYANLIDLFSHLEYEGGKVVGLPTGDGNVGYLNPADGIIAVNKNYFDKEAISVYLSELFSKDVQESQGRFCFAARKIMPSDYYTEEDGKLYYMGNKTSVIPVFSDGRNALEKGVEFLEKCKGVPYKNTDITSILSEELAECFDNGRASSDTADVINRRVEIYVMEHK